MKFGSTKRRFFLFTLILVVAVGFIVSGVVVIAKVNGQRSEIEHLGNEIILLSDFELQLNETLDYVSEHKLDAFRESFQGLPDFDFQLNLYPDLSRLEKQTKLLNEFYTVDGVLIDLTLLREELEAICQLSVSEQIRVTERLANRTSDLDSMWVSSQLFMLLACLFSVGLVFFGYTNFKSQQRLNQLKERNSVFMKSLSDCVIIADIDGRITEYNLPFCETFGYSKSEAIGKHIRELYSLESDFRRVQLAMEKHASFHGEIINVKKNGDQFIASLSANSVFNDEGIRVGSMGISRDVSAQKRTEEQFQHIIDNATDIIYTTDIEGNITYVNTSANSVLGYSNADFDKMSFRQLIHPAYLEEVERFYKNQFSNRQAESYLECKMVKADGQDIWIGQNVRALFSPIDPTRITGFFGILRNLNEVKRVEFELQESEAKYRELFENSKDLIQSVDANGQFLYVNGAWLKTMGYSEEELKAMNLFDLIHADSRDYCEELLTDVLKLGELEDETEHVFKMITKQGEVVVLTGSISVRFTDGQVESLQTFLRDVTEQQAVELALKKSEENLRLIGKSLNDVFFLYDVKTSKYDYISPKCEAVLGTKAEFFINGGNYASVYVLEEDRAALEEVNKRVREGENGLIEYRRMAEDGGLHWVEEKWFPIKDRDGNVVSISGICRDITDMKSAYDTIFVQNLEISQSILYAKNIQESTFPTQNEVTAILPNSFVFYKAKDVLSGDFYLVDQVLHQNGTKSAAFIVGDCTGHGVPGGLLSLLCSGLITESLTSSRINSPAEALDFVREKLIRLFRSNPSKYILDGMDAAFCVLNYEDLELNFAGANLSCYIVRNNEVMEYKGDKQHIGYSSEMAPFVNFTIDVEPGDHVYLTTDGYVDQFGGTHNKKFLRKRFTELLLELNDLSIEDQKLKIEATFMDWKGTTDQTDDVAMIGVKI